MVDTGGEFRLEEPEPPNPMGASASAPAMRKSASAADFGIGVSARAGGGGGGGGESTGAEGRVLSELELASTFQGRDVGYVSMGEGPRPKGQTLSSYLRHRNRYGTMSVCFPVGLFHSFCFSRSISLGLFQSVSVGLFQCLFWKVRYQHSNLSLFFR